MPCPPTRQDRHFIFSCSPMFILCLNKAVVVLWRHKHAIGSSRRKPTRFLVFMPKALKTKVGSPKSGIQIYKKGQKSQIGFVDDVSKLEPFSRLTKELVLKKRAKKLSSLLKNVTKTHFSWQKLIAYQNVSIYDRCV